MRVSASCFFAAAALGGGASAFNGVQTFDATHRISGTKLFERKPFITGNWKLNPSTRSEAVELAKGIADAITPESPECALFVPFPFMGAVQEVVGDKVLVGAEVSDKFKCLSMCRYGDSHYVLSDGTRNNRYVSLHPI